MSIGSEFRLVDFVKIPALTSFGSCLDAKLFGLNVLHDRISFFFHLLKVLETNVCSWNVLFFFFFVNDVVSFCVCCFSKRGDVVNRVLSMLQKKKKRSFVL